MLKSKSVMPGAHAKERTKFNSSSRGSHKEIKLSKSPTERKDRRTTWTSLINHQHCLLLREGQATQRSRIIILDLKDTQRIDPARAQTSKQLNRKQHPSIKVIKRLSAS